MKKLLMLTIFLMVLTGCTVTPPDSDIEDTIENGGAYKQEVSSSVKKIKDEAKSPKESESSNEETKQDESYEKDDTMKILSTHKFKAESVSFNEDLNSIINFTHEVGGYVGSNIIHNEKAEGRHLMKSEITLRIPKDKVNELIDKIDETVVIVAETLTSVDVTDKYYDIESRIKNLESREERLRELYNNSNNVEEIIKIDDKLFEVTEEKEKMIQEQMKMKDKIAFSRIDLELNEVSKFSIKEKEELTAGQQIASSFASVSSTIKNGFITLAIVIINVLPFALLIIGVYIGYRKILSKYEEDKGRNKVENHENNNIKDDKE